MPMAPELPSLRILAPKLHFPEKAGALSRLCSRPMKKSRCGGSLDGVDFKVYQRRASSLTPKS
jgi:hypothetical protein